MLRTKFELGLFERPLRRRHPGHRRRPSARRRSPDLAADSPGPAWCCCATTASCRSTLRPLRRSRSSAPTPTIARNLHGDYSYAAHVESLREMRTSDNIFNVPVPETSISTSTRWLPGPCSAISDALPGVEVVFDAGLCVGGPRPDGIRRRRRRGRGESTSRSSWWATRPASLTTRPCGEAGDRSSLDLPGVQEQLVAPSRDRHAGRARAHRRPPRRQRRRPRSSAAVLEAWIPGTRAGGDRRRARRRGEPRRQAADLVPADRRPRAGVLPAEASGGRSHWKGDYADAPVSPLYAFGHGLSYTIVRLTVGSHSGGHRRGGVGHGDRGQHRRARRRRGRAALHPGSAGIVDPSGARVEGVRREFRWLLASTGR